MNASMLTGSTEGVLSRYEMKMIMAGSSGCTYSDCSCLSTYDCYRSECLNVYGAHTPDGEDCVEEVNDMQSACIIDCNFMVN